MIGEPTKEFDVESKLGNGGSYPSFTLIWLGIHFSLFGSFQSETTSTNPKSNPAIKKLPDKILNEYIGQDN